MSDWTDEPAEKTIIRIPAALKGRPDILKELAEDDPDAQFEFMKPPGIARDDDDLIDSYDPAPVVYIDALLETNDRQLTQLSGTFRLHASWLAQRAGENVDDARRSGDLPDGTSVEAEAKRNNFVVEKTDRMIRQVPWFRAEAMSTFSKPSPIEKGNLVMVMRQTMLAGLGLSSEAEKNLDLLSGSVSDIVSKLESAQSQAQHHYFVIATYQFDPQAKLSMNLRTVDFELKPSTEQGYANSTVSLSSVRTDYTFIDLLWSQAKPDILAWRWKNGGKTKRAQVIDLAV